jgi:enoyl-[acyl-carrier-protein] reductase (NADH)
MNKKKLTGKITAVVGGASTIGMGIVRALLTENATVIVPSSNAGEINRLNSHAADIPTGGLITLPTDVMDYDKASDIAGTIRQRFGKLDLVVTVLNNGQSDTSLTEMEITDWQKMMDENISLYFIAGRICLHLMKEQDSGVFINVCDADLFLHKPNSPLARIATESQVKLSLIFSEEIAPFNISFYHLFVNSVDASAPEMVGHHIVKLYLGKVEDPEKLFQHFLGSPLPTKKATSSFYPPLL